MKIWYENAIRQIQYDATNKETDKKINAEYTLEDTVIKKSDKIKYLGVTVTEKLRLNTHVSNIMNKGKYICNRGLQL